MSIRKTFCKNLNYYMLKKGIKQSDLVSHFKIAKSTISSWCTGTKLPRMDKIEALAAFLGVKTSDLLNGKIFDANEVSIMTIGERITNARISKGFSLTELANMIDVSKQTLYKYEKGIVTNIPLNKIECLAKALNFTPAYLMGWNTENLMESEFELLQVFQKLTVAGKEKVIDFANLVYTAEQTNKTSIHKK